MALKLPDHAHCGYCGDPIPFGETHCSEQCSISSAREAKEEKKREYLTYIMVAVILVAVTVIGYFISW